MAFLAVVSLSKSVCRTISQNSFLLPSASSSSRVVFAYKDANFLSVPDPILVPTRGSKFSNKTVKRRRTHPWWYWTRQKAKRHSSFIDKKNQQFLDSLVAEKREAGTPLKHEVILSQKREFAADSRRIGLIGRKIGILPYWTRDGTRGLTTVIHFPDNHVIKSYGADEYEKQVTHQLRWRSEGSACVVVGAETVDPQEVSAAYAGLFKEAGLLPKRRLTSMYVSEDARLLPGTPLTVAHFRVGDFVDVFGKTRDWGFQGVMKRWGMKGAPDNHTTKAHRRPGSIAQGRRLCGPFKGRKMPGHMGSERRGNVGVQILRIDHENQCIFVKGPAVPGVKDSWCIMYDSRILDKRPLLQNPPPFPTHFASEQRDEDQEVDVWYQKLHRPTDPTIVFKEDDSDKKVKRTGAKLAKVRAKK